MQDLAFNYIREVLDQHYGERIQWTKEAQYWPGNSHFCRIDGQQVEVQYWPGNSHFCRIDGQQVQVDDWNFDGTPNPEWKVIRGDKFRKIRFEHPTQLINAVEEVLR